MTITTKHKQLAAARTFLATLKPGDAVILTDGGKELAVTVQRPLGHTEGFGHPHSAAVTVGFGPGRYNREVSAHTMIESGVGLVRDPNQRNSTTPATSEMTAP